MPVGQIASAHIERFKSKTLRRGLSKKTVNNQLTVLKKCLETAYEWLALPGKPPKVLWLKCNTPEMDHLSAEECSLLLQNAEGITREMILMAILTGMRQGELKGLQWSSIDWHSQMIAVRHSLCDYSKQLTTPKSNRVRYVPIGADLYEMLFVRKKSTGYVFLDEKGRPFTSVRMASRLKAACKKAGLRQIG